MLNLFLKILGFFFAAVFFYNLYVKSREAKKVESANFYLYNVYVSLFSAFLNIFLSYVVTLIVYILLLILCFYNYVMKK